MPTTTKAAKEDIQDIRDLAAANRITSRELFSAEDLLNQQDHSDSYKAKVYTKIADEYLHITLPNHLKTKQTEQPNHTQSNAVINDIAEQKPEQDLPAGVVAIRSTLPSFQAESTSLIRIKEPRKVPQPTWHPPWKLMRVISGHTGWVRSITVDVSNEWFATGAGDRIIKIWDLASGTLKLSLTGHVSTVRGVVSSDRHPYLFSAGEDKQIKCWDLETNKVIRHYHGHLSGNYYLILRNIFLGTPSNSGRFNVRRS